MHEEHFSKQLRKMIINEKTAMKWAIFAFMTVA